MLYDKRWDKKAKADPFTMQGLVAWLEQQNPKGAYDYECLDGSCLYGQYMASHGISWEASGALGRIFSTPERSDFCGLVYEHVASLTPWTFGGALERARAALKDQP